MTQVAEEHNPVVTKLNQLIDRRKGAELLRYIEENAEAVKAVMNEKVFPLDLFNTPFQGVGISLMAKAIIQARNKDMVEITKAMLRLGGGFDDIACDGNASPKVAKYAGHTVTNLIFRHSCFDEDLLELMSLRNDVKLSGIDVMNIRQGRQHATLGHFDSEHIDIVDLMKESKTAGGLFVHALRNDDWKGKPYGIAFCCMAVTKGYIPTTEDLGAIMPLLDFAQFNFSLYEEGEMIGLDIVRDLALQLKNQSLNAEAKQESADEVGMHLDEGAEEKDEKANFSEAAAAAYRASIEEFRPTAPALPAAPATWTSEELLADALMNDNTPTAKMTGVLKPMLDDNVEE